MIVFVRLDKINPSFQKCFAQINPTISATAIRILKVLQSLAYLVLLHWLIMSVTFSPSAIESANKPEKVPSFSIR